MMKGDVAAGTDRRTSSAVACIVVCRVLTVWQNMRSYTHAPWWKASPLSLQVRSQPGLHQRQLRLQGQVWRMQRKPGRW